MNKLELINNFKGTACKVGLQLQKSSPQILIVGGVIGLIGAGVAACVATTKAEEVVAKHKERIDTIHEAMEFAEEGEYTEDDAKKDTTIAYGKTVVDFIKLYWPAVTLATVSTICILSGTNILNKRNAALAAAYAGIDTTFREYRDRVVTRFGESVDKELRYGFRAEEITKKTVDEDGNEIEVVETVNTCEDPNTYSDYARFFDDGCLGWTKDPEDNLMFLKTQQSYANDKLKSVGHLYLNEVYGLLGIPKTKAGHVVGWIYDEKHPNGDNLVDFGLYDVSRRTVRDFVNGYERTILLDFNVDGYIYDKVWEIEEEKNKKKWKKY